MLYNITIEVADNESAESVIAKVNSAIAEAKAKAEARAKAKAEADRKEYINSLVYELSCMMLGFSSLGHEWAVSALATKRSKTQRASWFKADDVAEYLKATERDRQIAIDLFNSGLSRYVESRVLEKNGIKIFAIKFELLY